jgi:hypothetical protein
MYRQNKIDKFMQIFYQKKKANGNAKLETYVTLERDAWHSFHFLCLLSWAFCVNTSLLYDIKNLGTM